MSKRSAKDELIARLDADIARVQGHERYIGADMTTELRTRLDADLAKFEGMRAYVTAAVPVAGEVPDTPKRTRKKRAAGLPTQDVAAGIL